jgi:phosphate transport system substrate-binding protein
MPKRALIFGTILACIAALQPAAAQTRNQIRITGSSTVFPFSTLVAENFARAGKFRAPIVEATGTGSGIKLFCSGIGANFPDIANASRRIKASEIEECRKAGVTRIVEVKIGFDGIVLAHSKQRAQFPLTIAQIYLALAATPGGQAQKATNWRQINATLPNERIQVIGPSPTSGTRDAFNELVMEAGCVAAFPKMADLKKTNEAKYKEICTRIREDGAYIQAGEQDNLIVQRLIRDKNLIGVFGYSFLEENKDRIEGSPLNGVLPTFENIGSGKYPVARSMYLYAKRAHVGVIPGLAEFLAEFTKESTFGPEGYLADHGLIPLPNAERQSVRTNTARLVELNLGSIK